MPKLKLDNIPKNCIGSDLRQVLSEYEWKHLRDMTHEEAGHKCSACGGVGDKHPVELHEVYEFNRHVNSQKLVGLISLCPSCHMGKHLSWAEKLGIYYETIEHICTVNQWTMAEFHRHYQHSLDVTEDLEKNEWNLDLTWIASNFPSITKYLITHYTPKTRRERVRLRREQRKKKKSQPKRFKEKSFSHKYRKQSAKKL